MHSVVSAIPSHAHCTWFLGEDVSNEGILQGLPLTLSQLVKGPSFRGGQEMGLELRGVDQNCIPLKSHLLQEIKLRQREQ